VGSNPKRRPRDHSATRPGPGVLHSSSPHLIVAAGTRYVPPRARLRAGVISPNSPVGRSTLPWRARNRQQASAVDRGLWVRHRAGDPGRGVSAYPAATRTPGSAFAWASGRAPACYP
jgi:hypothetical protein